jgi:hypothetical protein
LCAFDGAFVAKRGSSRPRYRISAADVAAFDKKRRTDKQPAAPRKRRKKKDAGVIEYFKE